jgi:hypothetical protein
MSEKTMSKVAGAQGLSKGSQVPQVKVVPSVPLREGARAPQVSTPPNLPTTGRPVSVTKPKG